MIDDFALIYSSFLEQYGIDLSKEELDADTFTNLLSTLKSDTSLGNVVMIRAEKDRDVIKKFNSSQRNIYTSWKNRQNKAKTLTDEEILKRQKEALSIFKGLAK